MAVTIQLIDTKSIYYLQALNLRQQILRAPLGLKLSDSFTSQDKDHFHFVALQHDEVVGCLILAPINVSTIKMRQVAVAQAMHGKGLGTQLVVVAEKYAREFGYEKIKLSARETALAFYEKLGYIKQGEPFIEVSLPRWAMEKNLH